MAQRNAIEVKNFAILKGEPVKIEGGTIHLPAPKKSRGQSTEKMKERERTYLRSDVLFTNGKIEFKFKTTSFETGVIFAFNTTDGEGVAIGLSKDYDGFVISRPFRSSTPLSKASSMRNYKLGEEILMRIEIIGSSAKLFVNNIMLCEASINVSESPVELRFFSLGTLDIYDVMVATIRPRIFVVMQFSQEYNELFDDVIKPVSEAAGYECVRADEFYTSTPILKDIIENIQQSTAIIAEITPDNPNVFYEIGYSHAINKPTILLCDRKREKLPFDLSSFRTLFYENTIAGKRKVENSLIKYLENIR